MDLADGLNSVQVIDTRVKADLVHNDDTSLLRLLVEFSDSRGNVAGGHNVGLPFDGGLDDGGVVGIGDERDDEVVGSNFALEVSSGVNVKGDGARVGKAIDQALGGRERPASYTTIKSSLSRNKETIRHIPTVRRLEGSRTMYSAAGRATNPLPRRRIFFCALFASTSAFNARPNFGMMFLFSSINARPNSGSVNATL